MSKTISEDYVSFETAKLLKEKGFESDECIAIYDLGDNNAFIRDSGILDNGPEDYLEFQWGEEWRRFGYYLAPTLQMAMKWLREVHNLYISVEMGFDVDNPQYFFFVPSVCKFSNKDGEYFTPFSEMEFNTYEDAAELAIKYCLEKLI